nr:hypothetical protein [Tanacetum cinerariifolium]
LDVPSWVPPVKGNNKHAGLAGIKDSKLLKSASVPTTSSSSE